jgi:peptide/nickel transport system permease protein
MVAFCGPVYVVALGLLLAFSPDFGAFGLPFFFDVNPRQFDTIAHPLEWLRAYVLPWTVLALPIGGAVTRMMVGMIRDGLGADHIRTAIAKGVPDRLVMRRHVAPGVYPSVAALIWGLVPLIVTNAMLIEYTLNVPGFFLRLRAASGREEPTPGHHVPPIDIPMLSGIAMWTAACILVLTLLADLAVLFMDPRVRTPRA